MDELAIKATASLGSENDSPLGQVLFSRKKKKIERREVGKEQRLDIELKRGLLERGKDRETERYLEGVLLQAAQQSIYLMKICYVCLCEGPVQGHIIVIGEREKSPSSGRIQTLNLLIELHVLFR